MAKRDTTKPKPSRVRTRAVAISVVIAAAAVAAAILICRRGADQSVDLAQLVQPGDAAGFNLLLITLDTVRSDHLGCYGYAAAETPTINSLAARGVQFDDAITPVPITLPSHATMLTGLYPPRHGVRDNGIFRLASEHLTLAESLKAQQYDTAAFIGCFVLDQRFGLDQGFDTYDFEVTREGFHPNNVDFNQRSAGAVSNAAIQWLRERRQSGRATPFFIWVHYFDAHVPYQSSYTKLPRFAGRPYDAEIAYVDAQLEHLLDELDRLKLRDSTLIAVVSDHGEGLGEHGESTHGLFVYGSTMRVALILSCPRLFAGRHRVRDRVVSLVDLRPTLEDLLGLPPSSAVDGVSLLREPGEPDRAVYIETKLPFHSARCSPLYGLRRHTDKYVCGPEPEYFDLQADPDELNNLHDARGAQPEALATRLARMMESWPAGGNSDAQRRTLSAEEAERLSSLGYVQASAASESDQLPDPKAMMRANRKITEALRLSRRKQMTEALRLSREALRECPAFPEASHMLANLYEQMNQPEKAIAVLQESLKLNPQCATALQLARLLMRLGRYDEMEAALTTASTFGPHNGFVHILRGDRYSLQGRLPEAIAEFEEAVRVDKHRVGALARPQIDKLRKLMQGDEDPAP